MPLAKQLCALVDVIDRVDADEHIERLVVKRQPLACVRTDEAGALGQPALARGGVRRGHAGFVDVHADDRASRRLGQPQRAPARSPGERDARAAASNLRSSCTVSAGRR